jgi:chromosome segregation protein
VFLKNLTLKGFKSFADHTSLDLEPGVTVVVGPNGSGKSNVVDAIAWVLGAQAPSSVRSTKMDDVIFAGTSEKAALGRAEVSLTIDNSSGLLPLEFNEVKLTRTLFRNGESEYAINGVPCRLLDITDLLSDGGVGRQQHVIISQGQIDAVLNARPEDRRAIIEEAAGVLKFRKRKERAERRLLATDTDLTRVKDLMREVRRQLRPLEKQAEAARRHGDLVSELSALRIHLAGREILELREGLSSAGSARNEQVAREADVRARVEALSRDVASHEQRLADHGGDDLGDSLIRLESLRERARGLAALVAERHRGIERERAGFADRTVIANLEAEAERCRRDLDAVAAETSRLAPEHEQLAEAEARLAADRSRLETEWGDGIPVPSGQAAEVRGEMGALRAAIERGESETRRLESRLADLDQRRAGLESAAEQRRSELSSLHDEEEPAVAVLEAAESARDEARAQLARIEAKLFDAESEHHRWVARAEALTLALAETGSGRARDQLASIDGVLGALADVVSIDAGWEPAVEAALGDALRAVVVRDPDAARAALAVLEQGELAGAVIALGDFTPSAAPAATGGGLRVRDHVRGTAPRVDDLLDVLIGGVTAFDGDWREAADLAAASPDSTFVTTGGDRFGPSGWRLGVASTSAALGALAEAEHQATVTRAACEQATDERTRAEQAASEAQARADERAARLDELDAGITSAADALQRIETDRRELETEAETLRGRVDELSVSAEREGGRLAELEQTLPGFEADEAESLERGRRLAAMRAEIEDRATAVGALRTDLEVRVAALEERGQGLRTRLTELDERLERDAAQRATLRDQQDALDRAAAVLERSASVIEARTAAIEVRLAEVRDLRRKQSEAAQAIAIRLDDLRRERSEADRLLEELRSAAARVEIEEAELRTRLQGAVERLRAEHRVAPDVAISAPCPELDETVPPARRVEELETELEIMGPVNPLALEEHQALSERNGFLQGQLDDIRSTRRELTKVIHSIDEEIMSVFAAAYADVSINFEQLFETLFPGGQGRIRLTDPEDLLNTGVELEAKPSGKNVRKLSLLSGGERSLTALAFLFAVFRSRPSPFYVMDEVEAALDDVNLHRFLTLVDEFRADAQLVLVSHQQRTMEAADCLYGVTMKPGGSSRVVSERVTSAA